jgi:hypothetical protein
LIDEPMARKQCERHSISINPRDLKTQQTGKH